MFKNILVCSDGSATALKAAKRAIELARESDGFLVLLNVQPCAAHAMAVPWQLEAGDDSPTPYLTSQQKCNLEQTLKLCAAAGIRYRTRHECGHAADQILRVAGEEEVDLIVM